MLLTKEHCKEAKDFFKRCDYISTIKDRDGMDGRMGTLRERLTPGNGGHWLIPSPEGHLCSILLCYLKEEEIVGMTFEEGFAHVYLFGEN